ncbi:glycoside hydrolase family 43 protein [Nesterenkonia sp. PF2B19]|uniref:glycoside hydrolase family 43 protein n=1 Tax=Nesterenkonia sp. PF2B19 TaxID=1881858 RepID=UPI0014825E31|nr:glycoside hydrolase 43 family protein [Nesterenkonia sp. PF2B19]
MTTALMVGLSSLGPAAVASPSERAADTDHRVVGSSDQGDGTYLNPVIWADVPDPDVIRVGDAFYMSSTTMHMNPGVPIMKSYDLVNWETVSYAYLVLDDLPETTLDGSDMYSQGTWASTLRYRDGTFHLVVFSYTTDTTYFFQTEDPENEAWRRTEVDGVYHDPSLLLDDDGRNWLAYGNDPLQIIELNETVTGFAEGAEPEVLLETIHAPDPETGVTPTEGLAEGCHIQKIEATYYIECITWPPGKPRTQVAHRAESLDGPWESRTIGQEDVRIGDSGGGPAQGHIVELEDGRWYGVVFRDSGAAGRMPWLIPITWVDGWPMYGEDGTGQHMTREGEKPIPGFEPASVVSSDEFTNDAPRPTYTEAEAPDLPEYAYNGSNLSLDWQWNHNPDNRFWSLTDREGWLRLTTGHLATDLLDARNTLTQRTFGPTSSAEVALDVSGMNDGDRAGLSLFTARYGAIDVRMDDGGKSLVMVNSSSTTSRTVVESVPLTGDTVYLKAEADFTEQVDHGTFYYSIDGVHWEQLGDTQQMAYGTDNHFMGYRFALYNYATTELGGHVDFDYYRISDELTGVLENTEASASVERAPGSTNTLTITVTETWSRGTVREIEDTFEIRNNAAGTYDVGPYRVVVDTHGGTSVREVEITV